MQVYELAGELGLRTIDLIERAERAGAPGLTPSTDLTPQQVADVRARIGAPQTALVGAYFAPPPHPTPSVPRSDAPGAEPAASSPGTGPSASPWRRGPAVAIGAAVALLALITAVTLIDGSSNDRETARAFDPSTGTSTEPTTRPTPSSSTRSSAPPTAPRTVPTTTTTSAVPTTAIPTTTLPPSGTFGIRGGRPAPITDVERFCNGNIDFSFAMSDLYDKTQALNPAGQQEWYREVLRAWFAGQSPYPTAAVDAMYASFGSLPPSEEAVTLHDLGEAITALTAGGGGDVSERAIEWGDRLVTALNAVAASYPATC